MILTKLFLRIKNIYSNIHICFFLFANFSNLLWIKKNYLMNPMIIAIMLRPMSAQWETSAKYMASKPSWGWWTSTKNRMRHMRDPTRRSKPKNSPLLAPTQSIRPALAWAMATALRDKITSRRCSRSSSPWYLGQNNHGCNNFGLVVTLLKSIQNSAFYVQQTFNWSWLSYTNFKLILYVVLSKNVCKSMQVFTNLALPYLV